MSALAVRFDQFFPSEGVSDGPLHFSNIAVHHTGLGHSRRFAQRQFDVSMAISSRDICLSIARAWGRNDDITVVTVRRKS